MNPRGVTVTTRADGDVVLIVLDGEIDLSNAAFVEEQIAAAISNRTVTAALDLTLIRYIDSIGMRVLFAFASRLAASQIGCKFIAPSGSPARRVIEVSGLDAVVNVVESG
jgi:stage II sporulation protein AA (anti-sigma F factor antagonist)